jgi:dihydropteroate synthase
MKIEVQDTIFYKKKTLNIGGKLLSFDEPKIMGVLNITPDSFYSGSRISNEKDLLETAEKMISEGADFIDIGGYSSRPGAEDISVDEEAARVIPAVKSISGHLPEAIISIDTFRSRIAAEAVGAGASIINDISAGQIDAEMLETVAGLKVPYIMMHMRGTPSTMNELNKYENLITDLAKYFSERINLAHSTGISDIIIDPGIGFAKTISQNFEILKNLAYFHIFGFPLMIGVSRKSLIYKTLKSGPDDALNGTTVLNTLAVLNGASILRAHDVKEAKEVIKIMKYYIS